MTAGLTSILLSSVVHLYVMYYYNIALQFMYLLLFPLAYMLGLSFNNEGCAGAKMAKLLEGTSTHSWWIGECWKILEFGENSVVYLK